MKISVLTAMAIAAGISIAGAQTPPVPPAPALSPLSAVNVSGYSNNADGMYFSSTGKTIRDEDLKSKEVSKEIAAPKNADVYIENASRNIVIKTWDQQKVKVTTTVYYEGETKLTDEEWLEKVNLSVKTLGNSVKIKSGSIGGGGTIFYSDARTAYSNGSSMSMSSGISGSGGVAVFNGSGQNAGTRTNIKRIVTVYLPAGSKIDVESKYADVTLPDNSEDVNADISNGNLEGGNVGKFILRSKYSNINIGDLKTAEVEMTNGRFSAKTIDDLDIDSKYSTVEMAAVKKLVLRSTNDEYELEEAGEVRGRKNYGNLRITKLNNSLEIDGSNADVKVRKVGSSLTTIKIDDRYADIRIPLRDTKNYSVDFAGNYSSVYGNFEKKPVTGGVEEKASAPVASQESRITGVRVVGWGDNSNPSKFTAAVGDGKGLKLDIKCQNCTVDFK